jgi:hypothetical protein
MRWFGTFKSKDSFMDYTVASSLEDILSDIRHSGFAVIDLMDVNRLRRMEAESLELVKDIRAAGLLEQFLAVGRVEDPVIRNRSTEIIERLVISELKKIVPEDRYDFVSGIHLLKPAGRKGILNPHQDSSLVDESLHLSFFFWMPVTRVGENEGTLELIPGSHRLEIPFRSLNIPWPLLQYERDLWKFMKKIVVRPGQAVLFHSKMVHASGANKNKDIRIAVNSFIKPKEASLLHYYSDAQSRFEKIESFRITPDFFYNEKIMERPSDKYPMYKEERNTNKAYTLQELQSIFTSG